MTTTRIGLAAVLLFAFPAAAQAPQTPPGSPARALSEPARERLVALRDGALAGTRAWDIVRSLTVEVGPRLAGSEGDRRAVAWAQRTLKELGFPVVRAEKVTVPHWERGENTGAITAPWPQPVVLTALGGSVATPAGGVEAEVVRVESLAAIEQLDRAAVEGRIVFYDVKMERAKDGSGYGRAVPVRGAGASRAAAKGAVAVLIRSIGTSNDRVAHTGAMRYEEGVAKIPAAALSNPDADLLAHQVASGRPVRFRLRLLTSTHPDAESANVIAEVPGRERPEEIVLLGCHLDSWDLGTGAHDDGAGCAIVVEAARRILELPERPRRTVRVVLYANEEFGLSGARAYAEAHAAEVPRHVMATESDFGAGRVWSFGSRVAPEALPKIAELAGLLAPLGIGWIGNDSRGGADLSPLRPLGVPVLGLGHDGTLYFDVHHTANDTLDKIDREQLDQSVAAYAAAAYFAAEMEGDFGRTPGE